MKIDAFLHSLKARLNSECIPYESAEIQYTIDSLEPYVYVIFMMSVGMRSLACKLEEDTPVSLVKDTSDFLRTRILYG